MTQSRWWSLVAMTVAVATAFVAGFAPLGVTETCQAGLDCTYERTSLVQDEGLSMLGFLLVPAVVAALPVLLPRQWLRITVLVVLTLLMLIAIASIGMFLMPTLVIAVVAVGQNGADRNGADQNSADQDPGATQGNSA